MDFRRPNCWPLEDLIEKDVAVIMNGGREVVGALKGFDDVGNVVLVNAKEVAPIGGAIPEGWTPRSIGTAVLRAPHICSINFAEVKGI